MARVAIVSDVHGNAAALEAVLDDADRRGAEAVLCLGDVVEGGPQPRESLELARERCSASVLGNCDSWLTEFDPAQAAPARADVGRWAIEQIGEDGIEWLRGLPLTAQHAGISAFHASPTSFVEALWPDIADADLAERLAAMPGPVLAGGHTHVQWTRELGDRTFVNPGTVGCAETPESCADLRPGLRGEQRRGYRRYRADAEYALVDGGSVELVRVPYDVERVRHAVRAGGVPHSELALRRWADG